MSETRLDQEELRKLIRQHKRTRRKKDADKIKCIIYWGKGWSWEQIKEALFITDGTIKNYVDKYTSGGVELLLEDNYESNNYKMTKEQEQLVIKYVDNNNVQSSKQVCNYVKKTFDIDYTESGMTKTLKRLGFSYKKPKRISCKVDPISQENFIFNYKCLMESLKEKESVYFVDASGFEYNTKIDYGWIRRGKKTKHIKTTSGRKKINVNGAYNPITKEVITIEQESSMTTKSNIDLIEKIISYNKNKKRIILILDNAKMNKNPELFKFVNNQFGLRIELFYLPTYSPNLNLIERLWRFSKKILLSNKYYSTFVKFKKGLKNFFHKTINSFKNELDKLMTEKFQTYEVA